VSSAKRSGRFPYGWIIIILAIALLYATNPSEGQFISYLKNKIREQADGDETLAGDLQRMLAGPAASLPTQQFNHMTWHILYNIAL